MAHTETRYTSRAWGWFLVAVQGVLFLAVALWPSSWGPEVPAARELGVGLFLLGVVGSVASVVHLGRALTPLPHPNGTGMTARGVYRWVRHPMYTSVLVVGAGVATVRGTLAVWALLVILVVFFDMKTRLEEGFLIRTYDGYCSYAARTGKFIPGLGRRR